MTDPLPPIKKLTLDEALASARETRALILGSGVVRETARVFVDQFPGSAAVVIADGTTFRVAGNAVLENLNAAGVQCFPSFIFSDPALYAEIRFVEELEAALRPLHAIPIAVGSGTINDLTKLAAHRIGLAGYICVATAASMDGYTAFGASITFEGAKQTFNCPAPRAVIADIGIIRAAPPAMTAAGYADLAAKITAGADWLLADALGAEALEPRAWSIVQSGLRDALADPAGARAGTPAAIAPLVEGLMLGGFAMQWSKSSRPASGAEHQFSHLWDMEHHQHLGAAPSHGFKVGVATLAITRFYEQFLAAGISELDIDACCESWPNSGTVAAQIRADFAGTDFVETALAETRAKQIPREELRAQLRRLAEVWPELSRRLHAQLVPSAELQRQLAWVGAPTEPEQIGISRARLRETFFRAYHIRRRFTVLDLAVRVRLMDRLLAGIFGPGACWDASADSAAIAHHS